MSEPSLAELEAERDRLYAQLSRVGDFRRGSVWAGLSLDRAALRTSCARHDAASAGASRRHARFTAVADIIVLGRYAPGGRAPGTRPTRREAS
jgi:hypothetical protein